MRVTRGPDWRWGNQDGGSGSRGTVVAIKPWLGEPSNQRYGVRVVWEAGGGNTYRWGAEDAYDLRVVGFPQGGPAAAMSLIYFAITLLVSWLFYTLMTKDDAK